MESVTPVFIALVLRARKIAARSVAFIVVVKTEVTDRSVVRKSEEVLFL